MRFMMLPVAGYRLPVEFRLIHRELATGNWER
jgi:hypothetical protein